MGLPAPDPAAYDALLEAKIERSTAALRALGAPAPEIHPSPPLHYRMRAEFRVWHDGHDLFFVMFDPEKPREPVRVDRFLPAADPIGDLMPRLRSALCNETSLRRKLFQAEFHTTLAGDTMLTLAYHRPLDEVWQLAADALAQDLGCSVIGRARGQKRVVGRDWVEETLHIDGEPFRYRQYEQAFSQPNARVNEAMIAWVRRQAAGPHRGDDLLELYCGNGNFTLPLASSYRYVLATEVSKVGLRAARHNASWNDRRNVMLARLSAEEMSEALAGQRRFRRLSDLPVPFTDLRLRHLFVDPPRAGLDAATRQLLPDFDRVLYISCNPQTLARDLEAVAASFSLTAFAVFDQFPYTDHLECGIVLDRCR